MIKYADTPSWYQHVYAPFLHHREQSAVGEAARRHHVLSSVCMPVLFCIKCIGCAELKETQYFTLCATACLTYWVIECFIPTCVFSVAPSQGTKRCHGGSKQTPRTQFRLYSVPCFLLCVCGAALYHARSMLIRSFLPWLCTCTVAFFDSKMISSTVLYVPFLTDSDLARLH